MSRPPIKPADLTDAERDAIRALSLGPMTPVLPKAMTDRLIKLGLVDQRLGGFVLTQHGQFIRHAIG